MKILFLDTVDPEETRSPVTPESVARLVKAGYTVWVHPGLMAKASSNREEFEKAGAEIVDQAATRSREADILVRTQVQDAPSSLHDGVVHLSLFDPFSRPLLTRRFAESGATALSPELLPRTTLAQRMDVLSSQASLAGYAAVIWAAQQHPQGLPMMMTPAGTLKPARVFIIGAGVAGLQAIATAKRNGARVEAFDTRPVVAEQVQSLGAKFLQVDLGETGQTKDGYAKALTEEQLAIQKQAMAEAVARADIVITTAKLFGRPAPQIVTKDMLAAMKPGSVVVDLAADSGGNVEGVTAGKAMPVNGVTLYGPVELARSVPQHASQMLASNFAALLEHLRDPEGEGLRLDSDDELIRGSVVTHQRSIVHPLVKEKVEGLS